MSTTRHLGATIGMGLGAALLASSLIVMNQKQEDRKDVDRTIQTAINVDKKKKPPPKPKKVKKAKPKPRRRISAAPRPKLNMDVSGLGASLPAFGSADLSQMADGMLGGDALAKDMVMTEDAVDQPPRQAAGQSPVYPSRARRNGIEGYVTLRLFINENGEVTQVKVVEAAPAQVFEDAALQAAQSWKYEPATYQGTPVRLWITQRVRFKLGLIVHRVAAILGVLTLAAPAFAEPSEVDPVALATVLLKDGHIDRAAAVLEPVDPTAEGVDAIQYHRLRGLIEEKRGNFLVAATQLKQAIAAGDTLTRTHLILAQCQMQAEKPREALATLSAAPKPLWDIAEAYLLEAFLHWKLENAPRAFAAVDRGCQRFPKHEKLLRQRALLLTELGLYQAALDAAKSFLATNAKPEDYAMIGEALLRGRQFARAALLLEEAVLRFPEDVDLRRRLALSYVRAGRPTSAGEVLRPLAYVDAELAHQAAELYKKAGSFQRAIRMNARVTDQKEKVRQRLGILIELQRYEEAAALSPRLSRLGLLEEDPIAYALAYAHFQTGAFDRAEALLTKISDRSLFEQSVALRKMMDACTDSPWQCR